MTFDNFLSYLQQLLTMVDADNEYSVALAQNALSAIVYLARISGKADAITIHSMVDAEDQFRYLVSHRDEFIGVPGEYEKNRKRRRKLGMLIRPTC